MQYKRCRRCLPHASTVKAIICLLFGLIPTGSYFIEEANGSSCEITLKAVEIGSQESVNENKVSELVLYPTLTNCSGLDDQLVTMVVEVRSSLGITEYLRLENRTVNNDKIELHWTPTKDGEYEIRTFSITNLGDLLFISSVIKTTIEVKATADGWVYQEPSEPFSIILIPDTQHYWDRGNEAMAYNQSNWIVENADELNVKLVIHLGDIVDIWNGPWQWEEADQMMKILEDNEIPYLALPGNHDFGNPYSYSLNRNYSYFKQYFPESRLVTDQPLDIEKITSNSANLYSILSIGRMDFLVVSMEYCPTHDVIMQVDKVIKENSNLPVILATHAFLRSDGTRSSVSGGGVCTQIPDTDKFTTEPIWDLLVYPNENVFLVLSGHSGGENNRIDKNQAGHPVQQVVIDYQYLESGGDGFLKILTFDPEADKIHFQTFSPWLGSYPKGRNQDFTFNYNLN